MISWTSSLDCMNNSALSFVTLLFVCKSTWCDRHHITTHLSELAEQRWRYLQQTRWTVRFSIPFLLCLLPYQYLKRRASLMSQQVDP